MSPARTRPALIPELKVADFPRSREFYTAVAGFTIDYERPEEAFAMLALGEARLMIEALSPASRTMHVGALEYPLGRGMNLQIEVTDVRRLRAGFQAHDYPVFLEIEERWYRIGDEAAGNRQFWVQDPDGYLLRFFQDLGRRPEEDRRSFPSPLAGEGGLREQAG
jgi:catechol 2,3-dioxygenase-like lactoylglutathione lyase family enzyme